MEHMTMSEEQFDALWQRAEASGHASQLAAEYPVWRHNIRRNLGVFASLVAVVAVSLPLLTHPHTGSGNDAYMMAYCNRPDVTNQYWVEMADALLMEA